jgi:hypothetical protein
MCLWWKIQVIQFKKRCFILGGTMNKWERTELYIQDRIDDLVFWTREHDLRAPITNCLFWFLVLLVGLISGLGYL